jgi:hypothetical protein
MKKFFPLCLLLIVALVWTVSIASNFDRTPTANSKEKAAVEKPRSTVEQPAVRQSAKGKFVPDFPVNTEPVYLDRTPTATAGEAEEAPRIAAERAGEPVVVPVEMGQRSASAKRMKDIKADGVISPDERALYEELLSMAAPGVELPMPLNIVSESEVNDSCHLADPIACGDTVWCATLTAGQDDNDWYTFTLSTAQNVTIETHPTAGACDPAMDDTYLELWEAPCDSMIAYNDDIGYPNYFSRIVINLPAGIYAINSANYYSQTGSYHLSVLCQDIVPDWNCVDDPPYYTVPPGKNGGGLGDVEPNDTCVDAGQAMCEYAYCGAVGTSTDSDWYYVDLPADTTYGLHVRVFGDDTPGQYANGGGLDPWVGLYASDCTTLVAANEDYYGTFPDAENYDSQIDPGYPNCFNPGERVYLEIVTNYSAPGPYLLIINCVPCEIPQQGCDEDSLTIDLTTDSYPSEISWDVVDQNTGGIVCSGGPYASPNTNYIEVCCLDSTGCYDFNIYDSFGDGGGPYDLYFNGVLFYSSDGNYGSGESVQYIGNGCPDPTGACCVGINCVATVTLDSCDVLGGDWYIDEDCSTFVCPYGACCLPDGICTATTNEGDCDALGGYWYENETCPDYQCLLVTSCDTSIYHNGDPLGGATASQCALDYPFTTETADDFVLPGTGTIGLSEVVAWFGFWNGPADAGPAYYDAINVTFYANDNVTWPYPAPGGMPIEPPDSLCSHMEAIPNGIIYTTHLLPGDYTYVNDGVAWRLMLPVSVSLTAGDTVWLGIEPVMQFGVGGQTGWTPNVDTVKYNTAVQGFPLLGTPYWEPRDPAADMAFCLIEAPPPVWSCFDDPPMYIPPDNKLPGGIIDFEPTNNTCDSATMIECEYAYCGDIVPDTDADWYYIDLPQDTTYGIHVRVFANDTPNQYAQGLGLDPWVGLYASDCSTLVVGNDDYLGTFPDAEGYDSQIDPGFPNCFDPGERVYIQVAENWGTAGPYLLIVNCVPCEVPMGACCVDEVCVATNTPPECYALGGDWYDGFTCPDFPCPILNNCDDAVYHNGDPDSLGGAYGAQCDPYYPMAAEVADDFILPGTGTVNINHVIAWFGHWNGPPDANPEYYEGVNVTVYANDTISMAYPAPGGKPIHPDPDCGHMELIPGGIVYTVRLETYEYAYTEDLSGQWRLSLPVDVTLNAGETYWLAVEPILSFAAAGQCGWINTDSITGNSAEQIFELLGTLVWTPIDLPVDMAFCLLGPAGCDYVVGDVNGSDSYNGLDITYGVNWFKYNIDPPLCPDCPPCNSWYYCGDVNGSCSFNGLDITYGVNYFKEIGDDPVPCIDCPPIEGPALDDGRVPETPSVIKTKTILEQKPGTK